jgi:S-layer protein
LYGAKNMNMISTGAFQTEMDASNRQPTLAEKFVAGWEKKNAKAARAGGVSLMALSLAACGSDDTATTTATTSTTTTTTATVTPVAKTLTLTTGIDSGTDFTGGDAADTFKATASTLSISDSLDGGSGTDTLKITDTAGGLASGLATNLTLTSIESLDISTTASVGSVGTTAVPQVNTYTMSGATANVVGITSIDIGANTLASDAALTVTFNGNTVGFASDTNVEETTAANMANAIDLASGNANTATVGGVVKVNDASHTAGTTVTFDNKSAAMNITAGMTVTGTSIAAGTTVVSATATVLTLSAASSGSLANNATLTIGGGLDHVVIFGEANGGQPNVGISNSTGMTVLTSATAVDGTESNSVTFTYGESSGSYLVGATDAATATNFVAALNAVAGSTVAVATGAAVAVTAATAGTALPAIAFTAASTDVPSVAYTTANVSSSAVGVYDVSTHTAITDITASAVGGANMKLAATQDATVVNAVDATNGAGEVQVVGGKVLNVTTAGTGSVDIDGAAITAVTVTGGSGGVDINNLGGAAGTTLAEGETLTKVTLTGVDGNSALSGDALLDVTVGGSTTGARTITINNDQATAGHDLKVTAAGTGYQADGTTAVQTVVTDTNAKQIDLAVTGKSSIDLTGNSAMKTLNVTGDAASIVSADMAILTKVDASGNSGGVNLGAINAATLAVTGGSGTDKLTIDTTAKYAINMGGGADTVTVTSATHAQAAVSGGDGTDTLVVGTTTLFDSSAEVNKYSSFETLSLADDNNTAENYNMALFSGVTKVSIAAMSHANDDITLTDMSATQAGDIHVVGDLAGDLTVDLLTDTGTTDSTSITLGAGTTTTEAYDIAGALVANGFETINLATNAGPSANAAGTQADIASFTSDKATAVTMTGAKFSLANAAVTKAATYDATALTGGLTIAGSLVALSTVQGSELVDTMTVGQIGSTYNGNGGKDVIKGLTTAIMANGGSFTTIDGGADTDTIQTTDAAQTLVDADFTNISNVEKLLLDVDGGANALSVTGSAEFSEAFSSGATIDADTGNATAVFALSNATSAVTLALDTDTTTNDVTVTTGSGADSITITNAAGTTAETNVVSGAGDDTITVNTTSTGTLDLSVDVLDITGGTGADTIEVTVIAAEALYVRMNIAAGDSTTTAYDTINHAVLANGTTAGFILNFDGSADAAGAVTNISVAGFTASEAKFSSDADGKVTFSGTSAPSMTLDQKIAAVQGQFTSANDTVVFEHSGSSFVFHNDTTNGDSLVMIAGLAVSGVDTNGNAAGELIIA